MSQHGVQTVHYGEPFPASEPVLYFLGPTWFPKTEIHWHNQGLAHLAKRRFRGTVALPTPRDGVWREEDEDEQIQWQLLGQGIARVIIMWASRDSEVTKIEFGQWYSTGKLVMGLLSETPIASYMRKCAKLYDVPTAPILEEVINLGLAKL